MIDKLKPYLEYKESDQSWIGAVPKHWAVLPNRAIFAEVKEREHPDEEMLSVTITHGVIRQRTLLTDSSKKDGSNEDKSAYKLVCPRDLAYNKMRAWQGAIGISDFQGIISPAYVVMRLRDGSIPRYFHHLYRTPQFAKEAERWSYGITSDMWSLRPEHFRRIYSPVPPPNEQTTIVRFLDSANTLIERAIRAKRKLVGLLNEQKQAIINRTLTRGLNAAVPFRPSGIRWPDNIPKHWDVKKLYRITDPRRPIMYGIVLPGPNVDSGVFIVKGGNCRPGRLRQEFLSRTTTEIEAGYVRSRLREQDIVFAIRGGVGDAEMVPADLVGANLTQDAARIAAARNIDPRWLLYSLRAPYFQSQVKPKILGATISGINIRDLKRLDLFVPREEEQISIVKHIEQETASMSSAIVRFEREIDLLREYRTRLVSDVVTGKLDVRGMVGSPSNEATEDIENPEPTRGDPGEGELVEENVHAEN